VQPTSPIRPFKLLNKSLKQFYNKKLDSLFTAQKVSDHFIWKNNRNMFVANYNYKKRPMRQKIEEKFLENGSFYIFKPEKFLKKKCRLFGKIGCFTMSKIQSFQIDDKQDVELFNNLRRYL